MSRIRGLLKAFGDVRDDESVTTLLMLANIFVILAGNYICKTVREPLILASGAETKSYAAAGTAIVLMAFVPAYSWVASRVPRIVLLLGVSLFFLLNMELFWLAGRAQMPYIGIAFFIWVAVFNNAVIAQFWSYGNDLFDRAKGERLFPVIAVGATLGSPVGAAAAKWLFERKVAPFDVLQAGVACLAISMLLYWVIEFREERTQETTPKALDSSANGFTLLAGSPYLGMICLLLLLLNLVNTTGEYILGSAVRQQAVLLASSLPEAERSASMSSFIGAYYGSYFFWVNITAIVLQAFVASRLVKWFGIAGVLFALPVIALGAYGMLATGVSLAMTRLAKTAENATDYSIMNVAKQMLWLPTSRDEKYKAKQAADTFVVRLGDVLSAALVWVGTTLLGVGAREFAFANVMLVTIWLALSYLLYREYRRRTAPIAVAA